LRTAASVAGETADADVEDILRLITPLMRTLLHPDGDT
jgi:hypothetical protein